MPHLNRRQLLKAAGASAAALALTPLMRRTALAAEEKKAAAGFTLPPLPYAYDALQPSIIEKIMKLHHDTHHAAYVKNLNTALEGQDDLLKMPIDDLLKNIDKVPEKIRPAVINNGGGHANHSLFWEVMAPPGKGGGGEPKGELAKAIDSSFGSFEKFTQAFADAGMKRFGSGWAWLLPGKEKLEIISLPNQDSPLLPVNKIRTPILGLDVWEHAYYLQYEAGRANYIKEWWKVVNWDNVAQRYSKAKG